MLGGLCAANTSSDLSYMYASTSAAFASTGLPCDFTVTRNVSCAPGLSVSRKVENSRSSVLSSHGT